MFQKDGVYDVYWLQLVLRVLWFWSIPLLQWTLDVFQWHLYFKKQSNHKHYPKTNILNKCDKQVPIKQKCSQFIWTPLSHFAAKWTSMNPSAGFCRFKTLIFQRAARSWRCALFGSWKGPWPWLPEFSRGLEIERLEICGRVWREKIACRKFSLVFFWATALSQCWVT